MADDLGFSPERLARIDRFLAEKYVTPGKLAGTLTMVARHGDIAHIGVTGHADIARGTPMTADTIFRIYSMTKPVTSVALMMLVEEGKIALDDPVHRYIPEWRNLAVYVAGTHRTGFQTSPVKRPMQVVDLLRGLQAKHGLAYLFVSHDLRVVRAMAHRIAVMKDGVIVEEGDAQALTDDPQQPYTKALMQAAFLHES